ncbi:MAG: pseudouridine-5'-phosphate glycosidase [Phycisphaerales bacterium]|nr:pseudouridine-5'-phosphate glycosidase [Phycisphaerales bacterium]
MQIVNRSRKNSVALETTLLIHGVPSNSSRSLAHELAGIVDAQGAHPVLVGVVDGKPTIGMTDDELDALIDAPSVPKANTGNLGVYLKRKSHAATTVSTTMELAHAAGVRVFATGGLGGVHSGYGENWDVSADLMAFTQFPVAVVTSGVKSILDVVSTREALETLGIPVVGFRTDSFPAFYLPESAAGVDARFDDADELADYVRFELARTSRGIVVANPIPQEHALDPVQWDEWLTLAKDRAEQEHARGRAWTPAVLGAVHEFSGGATLRANIGLVKSNTTLAGMLAARL